MLQTTFYILGIIVFLGAIVYGILYIVEGVKYENKREEALRWPGRARRRKAMEEIAEARRKEHKTTAS